MYSVSYYLNKTNVYSIVLLKQNTLNIKQEGKTVPTYRDEGHYDAVDITQVRAGVERQENTPGNMFQTQPNKEVKDQGPVPDKAHDTSFTDFRPAYMSPPFVVKEETGYVAFAIHVYG